MTHLVRYVLVEADDGEHDRMRTEVMGDISGAVQLLFATWTVPTRNRTSTEIYEDIRDRTIAAGIQADYLRIIITRYVDPVRKRNKLR